MAAAAPAPARPGARPARPRRERHRVRRGSATGDPARARRPAHDPRPRRRPARGGHRARPRHGRLRRARRRARRRRDGPPRRSSGRTRTAPRQIVAAVAARGADPTRAKAAVLFGPSTPPGAETSLRAERPLLVVVGAPGVGRRGRRGRRSPRPTSSSRSPARGRSRSSSRRLPEPLAEPAARLPGRPGLGARLRGEGGRVHPDHRRPGTAVLRLPRVQRRASCRRGKERGLDSTATRSLMGSAYPQPGLYSKFFDHDLEPLVEVVRDTVGRHDTFGLACTAKYYEDMGYFGHVNCSDNFNARARRRTRSSRGAAGRRSTSSTTRRSTRTTLYFLDEPWSRPGDYVLLRASTDLVCLSSACPDDIDAANGVEPDRGARPRLPGEGAVLGGDRAPRDARRGAEADAARPASTRARPR